MYSYPSLTAFLSRTCIFGILIIAALTLTACGSTRDRIIGRWQNVDHNEIIEFFKDGTYVTELGYGSINGRYNVTDDGRLRLDSSLFGLNTSSVYDIEFDGDTVRLLGQNGFTLKRLSSTSEAANTVLASEQQQKTSTAPGCDRNSLEFHVNVYRDGADPMSEYILVENLGDVPIDFTACTISDRKDNPNNIYTFPSFILAPHTEVKIWTKAGNNDSSNLYWGKEQPVWLIEDKFIVLRNAQGGFEQGFSSLSQTNGNFSRPTITPTQELSPGLQP